MDWTHLNAFEWVAGYTLLIGFYVSPAECDSGDIGVPSANFWMGDSGGADFLVLDLGCCVQVSKVRMKRSH